MEEGRVKMGITVLWLGAAGRQGGPLVKGRVGRVKKMGGENLKK